MSFYRIQYVVVAGFMIFAVFCESIGELFQDVGNLILASPVVLYLVVTNPNYLSKMKKSASKFFTDIFWDMFAWALIVFLVAVSFVAFVAAVAGCILVAIFILLYYVYKVATDYIRAVVKPMARKRRFSLESFLVDVLDTQDPARPVKGAVVFLIEPDMINPNENDLSFHCANVEVEDLKAARKHLDARINHHYAMLAIHE